MRSAAERLQSLLAILPRFARQPKQSINALSGELRIPPAELVADLAALAERANESSAYDYGAMVQIDGDSVEVLADHFSRPMRLTAAELCAFELGLGVLRHECPVDVGLMIDALLAKLRTVIVDLPRDELRRGVRHGILSADASGELLATLRDALRRGRAVTIEYQSANVDEAQERVVRPYGLCFAEGKWYLAGWCERSNAVRVFRVDRMAAVAMTDTAATPPPGFRLEDLVVSGRPWVSSQPLPLLVVRYGPAVARWIVERDGGPVEADGAVIRSWPLADREWAIRHVLAYAPDAEILEPTDLRTELCERLDEMLQCDKASGR